MFFPVAIVSSFHKQQCAKSNCGKYESWAFGIRFANLAIPFFGRSSN